MKKLLLSLIGLIIIGISAKSQNQLLQSPYPRTINVTGSAEMEIVPDEIYVQIDLREYKKKGSDKVNLETIKANFLSACQAAGIPDSLISIASYSGYNYNYGLWRRRKDPDLLSGISYEVKFADSKKMDNLIDRLDDDATTNFQIVKVSHSKIQLFRKQLKTEAVKQAKEKAMYLTAAIGEGLGDAVTINEPNEENNYPALNNVSNFSLKEVRNSDLLNNNENPAIDFKMIKLKYDVAVIFALK